MISLAVIIAGCSSNPIPYINNGIQLSGSQEGISYQLLVNGELYGDPIEGTGNFLGEGIVFSQQENIIVYLYKNGKTVAW